MLRCILIAIATTVGLGPISIAAKAVDAERNFSFRIPGEPETLDWNRAHTPIETHLLMNLMEGLVQFDSALQVIPALAEKWTRSPDGKVYTFFLRKDVKWSDGVPLKAQDFVASWRRLLSPLTAAPYSYFLFDIENAEAFNQGKVKDFSLVGIKAIDQHTLRVSLSRAVAHWIQIPTFWVTFPIREDLINQYGVGWEKPGKMVTLGPFVLSSYEIDQKVVLKRNPYYYGAKAAGFTNLTQVTALILKDDATAMNVYETGKLDFLQDLSNIDMSRLAGRPDLKHFPYLKTAYLGFNTKKFPVNSVKVRRAIAMAVDHSKFPQILHGGQTVGRSFVPPRMMGHQPRLGLKFDPEAAKKELKESGIDLSRGLKLEFVTANWEKALAVAQYFQSELKKNLRLDVTIQPFDHKTYRAQLDLGTFPLFFGSWAADYPDPDNYLSVFLSNSGNNKTGWSDPEFDKKVIEARSEMNVKKRDKIYLELQKKIQEAEVIIAPMYYEPNVGLVKARVKGLELNPLNYLYLKKVRVD